MMELRLKCGSHEKGKSYQKRGKGPGGPRARFSIGRGVLGRNGWLVGLGAASTCLDLSETREMQAKFESIINLDDS